MVVFEEVVEMLPADEDITHIFVCGGVGSIAAALFEGFYHLYQDMNSDKMPRFIVVEPFEADCLYQSAKHGQPCSSSGDLRTIMAGLACRQSSPAAWKVLSWLASHFVTTPDSAAIEGMQKLASTKSGDVPVVIGESSAASVGILCEAERNYLFRRALDLDSSSKVLLFGLEGATDPRIYKELCGKTPEEVFQAQDEYMRLHEFDEL